MRTETGKTRVIERLKRIRDSWVDVHEIRVRETNQANKNERRALKRFQEADARYQKALKKAGAGT